MIKAPTQKRASPTPARVGIPERGAFYLRDLIDAAPKPYPSVVPIFIKVVAAVETVHRAQARAGYSDPRRIAVYGGGRVELNLAGRRSGHSTLDCATFKYTAPELVIGEVEQTRSIAADSYALGFLFYEILLGRELFQQQFAAVQRRGELGWMYWHADRSCAAQPLHLSLARFPESMSRLIGGMIEKDAASRTVELGRVAEALAGAVQGTAKLSGLAQLRGEGAKPPRGRSKAPGFWGRKALGPGTAGPP